jgi:CheY-like chemotaxis protein
MQSFATRRVSIPIGQSRRSTNDSRLAVLFVSDDGELCAAAARVLEDEGYEVHTAAHSGHALLAGLTARIDVVVAELAAPEMSGPALADRLRRHHPDLQAVFLARPGTPEGLDGVLVRPFTRDDLVAGIRSRV